MKVLILLLIVQQCLLGFSCQPVLTELNWNGYESFVWKELIDELCSKYCLIECTFSFWAIKFTLATSLLFCSSSAPSTACRRTTGPGLRKDCMFLHYSPFWIYCNYRIFPVEWGSVCGKKSARRVVGGDSTGGWLGTLQTKVGFLPKHKFLCYCWRKHAGADWPKILSDMVTPLDFVYNIE